MKLLVEAIGDYIKVIFEIEKLKFPKELTLSGHIIDTNWHQCILHIQSKHQLIDTSCLTGIGQWKWERILVLRVYRVEYRSWYFKWRHRLYGIKGIEIMLQCEFWNMCICTLWSRLSKHEHCFRQSPPAACQANTIPIAERQNIFGSTAIKDELASSPSFTHTVGVIFWFGEIKKIRFVFQR